jgi:ABC-type transport system involved in multi-copper enzyme maturation permease subunit
VTRVKKLPSEERKVDRFEVETKGGGAVLSWPHRLGIFFGAIEIPRWHPSLGQGVYLIESTLINGLGGWVALLVAVVITAGFVPNLMRKGAVDLLLAKPIGRTELMTYKYLGGLMFILLTAIAAVGGVWLAVGLRTGLWGVGFLTCILGLTFYFAILYSVSVLTSVLTRNTVVSIVVTCGFWFVLYVLGGIHTWLDMTRKDPEEAKSLPAWALTASDTVNAITPRTKDLDNLTTRLISRDLLSPGEIRMQRMHLISYPDWGEVLGVSGAYIALFLGLACWRFSTRDY